MQKRSGFQFSINELLKKSNEMTEENFWLMKIEPVGFQKGSQGFMIFYPNFIDSRLI